MKLLYGLACQLVTIFVVLQVVRLLWSYDRPTGPVKWP